jgi:hypothetical protein
MWQVCSDPIGAISHMSSHVTFLCVFSFLFAARPPVNPSDLSAGAPPVPPPTTFPFGVLTISGTFTLSQMHEWVASCLPDVPLRLTAEGKDEIALAFKNVLVGTHLLCYYKKGNAIFRSDNPSALAILKEVRITSCVPPTCFLSRATTIIHPLACAVYH